MVSRHVFLGKERAAQSRLDAQQREKVGSHKHSRNLFRLAGAKGDVHAADRTMGRQISEDLGLLFVVEIFRSGNRATRKSNPGTPDHYQALGFLVGERAQ